MSSVIDLTALGLRDEYGPLGYFAELFRQERLDDEAFYASHSYFFVLTVPRAALELPTDNQFIFPLIIPPSSLSITEPFQVNQVQTLYGGLYVEEGGLNARTISIEGTTGFAPRKLQGNAHIQGLRPELKRHHRELQDVVRDDRLSGQKHFQFLQDRVFRAYGDLKRSPIEAKDTHLSFHMPHNKDNYRVVPMNFELEQTADSFPLYRYKIEMLAFPWTDIGWRPDDGKSWLQQYRSALDKVRKVLGEVRGALKALTEIASTLGMAVQGLAQLIGDTTQIIKSSEDFVNGAAKLIKSPLAFVSRTQDLLDATRSFVQTLDNLPSDIRAAYDNASLELQSSLDKLKTETKLFTRNLPGETQPSTAALTSPGADSPLQLLRGAIDEYPTIRTQTLTQGQTLESLAAQELGDPSLWPLIAELNDLKPPFFSPLGGDRLPNTLMVGDSLFIPSREPVRETIAQGATLGVPVEDGPRAATFGTDLRLAQTGPGEFDLVIDFEHGAGDFRRVDDIDNVEQALRTRMRTRIGEHPNFPSLGAPRIVGTKNAVVDFEMTRLQIIETILSDPRVTQVTGLKVEQNADTLTVSANANLKGVAGGSTILFPLGDE